MKTKMSIIVIGTVLMICGISGLAMSIYLDDYLERKAIRNLEIESNTAVEVMRSAISLSVRNRLQSIAETNLQILNSTWGRVQKGELSAAEGEEVSRSNLLSQKIGTGGYIACLTSKEDVVLHPSMTFMAEPRSPANQDLVRELVKQRTGYYEYIWTDPDSGVSVEKALYQVYFEPLDWIVCVTSKRDEFKHLVEPADFKNVLNAMQVGHHGYAFVVDSQHNILIHPHFEGRTVEELEMQEAISRMIAQKTGLIRYDWKSPDFSGPKAKMAMLAYVEEFDWILGVTALAEDIRRPAVMVRNVVFATAFGLMFALCLALGLGLNMVLRPILDVQSQLEAYDGNDLQFRLESRHRGSVETDQMIDSFNGFMIRLEQMSARLQDEIKSKLTMQESYRQVFNAVDEKILVMQGEASIQANAAALAEGYDPGSWKDAFLASTCPMLISDGIPADKELEWACDTVSEGTRRFEIRAKKTVLGEVDSTIVVGRDITEKYKTERAVRQAQEFLQSIIEASPAYIVGLGADRVIRFANSSILRRTRRKAEDVQGQNFVARFIHDDDRDEFNECLDGWLNGSDKDMVSATFRDHRILTADGEDRWVHWTVNLVRDPESKEDILIWTGLDMTEERRLAMQLNQSQKMDAVGQMAGGISHDFNNLLTGIINGIELLKHSVPADPKTDRLLYMLQNAGERAADLVAKLLLFSSGEAKPMVRVDLHKVIDDAIGILERSIGPTIQLDCKLDATRAHVKGDPSILQNALINLGINARDAMPQGGRLVVETDQVKLTSEDCGRSPHDLVPGEYVRVSVLDTGTGMTEAIRSRVFEPFFTTKSEGEGTGLGLATVYTNIMDHGGTIDVESELGVGTRFTVMLPCSDTAETGDRLISNDDQPTCRTGTGRILVVDDDENARLTTAMVLEELGYDITTCTRAEEALEIIEIDSKYDLVLTDMIMDTPMTGRDLFLALRTRVPHIRVIIMSGFTGRISIEDLQDEGLAGFIQKPFSMSALSQVIVDAMEQDRPVLPVFPAERIGRESLLNNGRAVVIEHDSILRDIMASILEDRGYEVQKYTSVTESAEALDHDGFEILINEWHEDDDERSIQLVEMADYCIYLSDRKGIRDFRKTMERGGDDFLGKPFSLDLFLVRIGVAEKHIINMKKRAEAESALQMLNDELEDIVCQRTEKLQNEMSARFKAEQKNLQQEKQLSEAERMATLGTLVAGVAHEINNPTHFIMLNLPLLKGAWESAVPVLDSHVETHPDFRLRGIPYSMARNELTSMYDDIIAGAQKIRTIISELKQYAKPSADTFREVDMKQVIASANTLLAAIIRKHTDNYQVVVPEDLKPIRCDAIRIEQVIINIVQNACLALESRKDSITLECRNAEAGEGIEIIVTDEGCGIPEEHLSRLADPFFTTRQASGGTGLGLAISMRILRDHGGSMAFQSAVGQGAQITISLPLIALEVADE